MWPSTVSYYIVVLVFISFENSSTHSDHDVWCIINNTYDHYDILIDSKISRNKNKLSKKKKFMTPKFLVQDFVSDAHICLCVSLKVLVNVQCFQSRMRVSFYQCWSRFFREHLRRYFVATFEVNITNPNLLVLVCIWLK